MFGLHVIEHDCRYARSWLFNGAVSAAVVMEHQIKCVLFVI